MRTPARPKLHAAAERIAAVEAIDGPAEAIAGRVRERLGHGALKDALSGTWLGHPLHPLLTDLPIGTWTSSLLLDLLGGRDARAASDRLIALGIASAAPTALSGWSDWADTAKVDASVRRIGVAHAFWNVGALALYSGSLAARRTGRRGLGVTLSAAGAGALALGGHLGGHLSYAKGVGVDRVAFAPPVPDWHDALADADLHEGGLRAATVAGQDVVLARDGGRVLALAGRCAHRGGPLADGEIVDGCVQCPWHASRFRLQDGSVERGPSTFPQPVYETRVREGRIEVRRPT